MASGKRKYCQEREGDARHVRTRLSTGTQVTLPLRPHQTKQLTVEDHASVSVPATIPHDDEPGGTNTPSAAENENEAKIQKGLASLSLSQNQKATKLELLAMIRESTGLAPEETLEKRFQHGHMVDGEWKCKEPFDWGWKFLNQLARIFAYATPDLLNAWLDERVKARTKEQQWQGTEASRADLAAFRRECWDKMHGSGGT